MSRIPLDDLLGLKPNIVWKIDPTPPPSPKERIPAQVMQEIRMTAQVQAFRAAMAHVRKCGDLKDFREDEAYALFKRDEEMMIESLCAKWIVEHGQDS